MATQDKNIAYVTIESDMSYFDTYRQLEKRSIEYFTDASKTSILTGSTTASGFFSTQSVQRNLSSTGASYVTSSTVSDPSGNSRKILAGTNDYLSGNILDAYKQGTEIQSDATWLAGFVKIWVGEPGHIHDPRIYGVTNVNLASLHQQNLTYSVDSSGAKRYRRLKFDVKNTSIDRSGQTRLFWSNNESRYYETDVVDPAAFVLDATTSWAVPRNVDLEAHTHNGVIEPLTIRDDIFGTSIDHPFKPRSIKGQVGNGNIRWTGGTSQVVSVYLHDRKTPDTEFFLDTVDTVTTGSGVISIGPDIDRININLNVMVPFVDASRPRMMESSIASGSYESDMAAALINFKLDGVTYIEFGNKTGTCGFTYDNAFQGTDSIAFGGMLR